MTIKDKLRKEALRAFEDVEISSKSHFITSERWENINLCLSIPSIILSVIAGSLALSKILPYFEIFAGISGFGAAALVSILTFLKPNTKYEMHMNFGNKYLSLKGDIRRCQEIEIDLEQTESQIKSSLDRLILSKKEIDSNAPLISNWAYKVAKKRIEDGETEYKIDRNNFSK